MDEILGGMIVILVVAALALLASLGTSSYYEIQRAKTVERGFMVHEDQIYRLVPATVE